MRETKLARQRHDTLRGRSGRVGLALVLLAAVCMPALAQPPGGWSGRRSRDGNGGAMPGGMPPGMPPGGMPGAPMPPGGDAPQKAPDSGAGPSSVAKTRPFDPENLPKENKGLISMTFENAEIGAVLRALSTIWGKTIALHPSLQGAITVISAKDVTPAESLEIMRTALNVQGFTLIGGLDEKTKILEVWPRRDAANQGTIVQEGNDPEKVVANIQVITQVVSIRYLPARTLGETLKPLLNKEHASIVTLEDSNSLVITDTGINIKRMLEIITLVDKLPDDRRSVEVVRLVHANATEVQKLLNDIFSNPLAALQRQLQGGGGGRGGGFGGMPGGGEGVMQMLQSGSMKATDTIKITADTRTNSLVLYGPPETLKTLRETITQLDQDVSRQVVFKRYSLQFADAAQVSSSLNQLFQQPEGSAGRMPSWFRRWGQNNGEQPDRGFTSLKENLVVPDLRTNSLLITATPENQRIYEELIRSMDQPSQVQDVVEVIPLEFAKAATVQQSLSRLLRGSNNDRGWMFFIFGDSRSTDSPLQQLRDVTVVAEDTSNSLILSGPAEALPTIRRLVAGLDQPQAQVYISVIIADVTLTDTQQLGVELSWSHAPLKGDTAATNFDLNQNVSQGIRYALVHDEFSALLRALSDKQRVKVLSTPHVTGVNNKQATISIGQRFPFPSNMSESQGGNVVASFDLKDIVVKLDVLPRVSLGSQMVTLSVDQQIDELTGTVKQGNFDLPLVATRRATTDVMVESGQTVVIGGIIRDKVDKQRTGVPILQDLPIIGSLFRSTKDRNERTELMVFLTPFVVTTEDQLRAISEQRQLQLDTEFPQLKEYLRSQEQLGGEKPPRPQPPAPEPRPMPRTDPTPRTQGALPTRPQVTPTAPVPTAPAPTAPAPTAPVLPARPVVQPAQPAPLPPTAPTSPAPVRPVVQAAPMPPSPPAARPVEVAAHAGSLSGAPRTGMAARTTDGPRLALPPLTSVATPMALAEPKAGGDALLPDAITPERIATAIGLPPLPPLDPLLSPWLATDAQAPRLASALIDVVPGLWGAWSGLLDPTTPSTTPLPLTMTRVVLPAAAPPRLAPSGPGRVVLSGNSSHELAASAPASPTRLVRNADGQLVGP